MADRTAIEWTDATWNPIVGCKVLSAGCAHCYAMTLAGGRLKNHPTREGLTTMTTAGPVWNGEVRFNVEELQKPLAWRRPRKIFVCAHGDLFYEGVTFDQVDMVLSTIIRTPRHTYQVLTKRPGRMREYFAELYTGRRTLLATLSPEAREPLITALSGSQPLPNVWLGTSAEDQETANERLPQLLATPAAVHFLSAEPLLGPMDLGFVEPSLPDSHALGIKLDVLAHPRGLDWVIVGGESGPKARPMHPNWALQIRDDCADAGVAFFFKQWGEWGPGHVDRGILRFLRPDGSAAGFFEPGAAVLQRRGKTRAGHDLAGTIHHAFPQPAQELAA